MKAVIAIDSFKGSLTSAEAASAVAEGLAGYDCVIMPVSDGGEGFSRILTEAIGGQMVTVLAHDPLGREIEASYGIAGTKAVIESAAASGLTLMSPDELDPLRASSRGTGEMIADAIRRGARDIYVGFGGTGTNDGGAGMLRAMEEVRGLWPQCRFTGLCDVSAVFCGPQGATAVYGPQKGVKPGQMEELDGKLRELAGQYRPVLGRDVLTKPGSGAAGGMAGALWAVAGGELKPGADAVLDILGFEDRLAGATLVVTGEGRIDAQTLQGKLPAVVARRARAFSPSLRVAAFAGQVRLAGAGTPSEGLRALFDDIIQITPEGTPLSVALDPAFAGARLTEAVSSLVSQWQPTI